MEGSRMTSEEGKKVGEKRSFTESVELFEQIFKEAAPSVKSSNENIPSPLQKPSRNSVASNVPKFIRRIEPQERTFKVRLKPSKRAPTDPGEPRRIEPPIRAQAEPHKKAQKRTSRRARWVAIVGLAGLVILATPVFLHSLGVIHLPGVPEFLYFSREVATPPPAPRKSMNQVPAETAPPKSDAVEPAPAAEAKQTSATSAQPLPTAERLLSPSPQAQRQPFSLYLGSFSTPEQVRKALSIHQREDFPPYAVRMDFGDKGVWYRIFMGHFQTREAAEAFIAKHQIHGAEVKETKYAVRLGAFGGLEAMEAKKNVLSTLGLFPYTIKEADGQVSLFTGAFLRKEDAERECRDLKSKGIQAETVER